MLRALWRLILTLVVVAAAAVIAIVVATDDTPKVAQAEVPTPRDVAAAKSFVQGVRAAAGDDGAPTRLVASEADLNSVIRLGARLIPGFRGNLEIVDDTAVVTASIPFRQRWLNLSATVPPFEEALRLDAVSVGRFPLAPEFALQAGRIGANLVLGNNLGNTVVSAADSMDIQGDRLVFDLSIDKMGENGVMRGVFGTMRGSDMPGPEQIDRYYLMIREAMERGDLPSTGSYLPYIRFTLQAAQDGSRTEGAANAYTSAILALTRACGAGVVTMTLGQSSGAELMADRAWTTNCNRLTLNGRTDSRLHFTTSAALQAASNRGFAASVGEFKELYDTVKTRKTGFDFTDIAANLSGIRMSNRFMSTPVEDWSALLQSLEDENDVIVPFGDIPGAMSGEDFEATYGSVDSPAYHSVLDDIEGRIDRLRLHAGG